MAKISVTFAELVDILVANNIIPEQISNLVVDGNIISFKYKIKTPFLTAVDISLEFVEFENGLLTFKIKTAWLLEKMLSNPNFFKNEYIEVEKSKIMIYLDMLVKEKLKGLQIDKIYFTDNSLNIEIYTIH
jgi:hypothetical protein